MSLQALLPEKVDMHGGGSPAAALFLKGSHILIEESTICHHFKERCLYAENNPTF